MGQRSSKDVPASLASKTISADIALGAGCYWGTEKFIMKDFQKKFPNSIRKAKVGFMSPSPTNTIQHITYEQVCHRNNPGFVEVLYVTLNEPHKHFEELIRFFFSFHDPTTRNRQGNDTGFQYGSYIFYTDAEQKQIAKKVKEQLNTALKNGKIKTFQGKKVSTEVFAANHFILAKREHQEYLKKHPFGYCNHYRRFKKWPFPSE